VDDVEAVEGGDAVVVVVRDGVRGDGVWLRDGRDELAGDPPGVVIGEILKVQQASVGLALFDAGDFSGGVVCNIENGP